jgi:hypothetical protein
MQTSSDLKAQAALFMGGVSPILYRLVVMAQLVKISAYAQNSCGRANFHYFL